MSREERGNAEMLREKQFPGLPSDVNTGVAGYAGRGMGNVT